MQALQIRTEIIEAVLNLLSDLRNGIVSVYQRYDYQAEKRSAMDVWGRHTERLTGWRDKNPRIVKLTASWPSGSKDLIVVRPSGQFR